MEFEIEYLQEKNKLERHEGVISRITLAHGIYFLIVMVAAALRLLDLGFVPLSPAEATEALATWNFWIPDSSPLIFSNPIYFSLTTFLTQVLGFSDPVMRLVPALFGTSLVILPWFLRHRLGIVGSLLAGLFFAFSPTLVAISRTAGGQSVAIFAGLLCFIAWLRYQETNENRWFYTLAVVTGLGLISAPLFYSLSLVFGLTWITQMLIGPPLLRDQENFRLATIWPERRTVARSCLLMAGVLIVGATAFLQTPGGLGATADIIADWVSRFFISTTAQIWLSPFMAIGRYEISLVILGLLAVIWATRNEESFPTYLVYALCWTFVIILIQPGEISNLLILAIPGYLLISDFAGDIFSRLVNWTEISVSLVVLLAGGIAAANFARFVRLGAFQSSQTGTYHLLLALTAIILGIIATTMIWSWRERSVIPGVVAGLILLLTISMWSSAWWLSRDGLNDTRELWTQVASDGDIRLLAESIKEISWQFTNSESDLEIRSTVDSPNLRWYLRDMVDYQVVSTLRNGGLSQALITPMDEVPPLTNDYIGTDFGYLRTETSHLLSLQQSLNWWLFRESPVPINEERLILWLRADLAGGAL